MQLCSFAFYFINLHLHLAGLVNKMAKIYLFLYFGKKIKFLRLWRKMCFRKSVFYGFGKKLRFAVFHEKLCFYSLDWIVMCFFRFYGKVCFYISNGKVSFYNYNWKARFTGLAKMYIFCGLTEKCVFMDFSKSAFLWVWRIILVCEFCWKCVFDENVRFCGFGGKMRFVFLAKNVFCSFGGKMHFCDFGRKIHF